MKKTIKLALVAALALGATSAFATNGATLMGMGAKSRGMGGTGIGVSHGAESALANPAMITSVENTEISFGGTVFMPNVKNENAVNLGGGAGYGDDSSSSDSDANMNLIPEVSLATKINDNFYVGVGMWGTGGMGVDYRDAVNTGQMSMVTNLQLMQFGVPLAYTANNFSVGITPILQYGSLDINYVMSGELQQAMETAQTGLPAAARNPLTMGAGVAQDLKFGYNIGLGYEISGLTIGAVYKSQIDMEYKGVMSTVIAPFTNGLGYSNDKLSTPAEMGVGVSYKIDEHTIAFDYKNIQWSKAKGYEDFEWKDQNIYAVGYEYNADKWAARIGYSYAKSPIEEETSTTRNSANLDAGAINTFNLLGFPAIIETHFSIGGSFDVSDKASVDLAYVYAPEVSETYTNFLGQDITTKHSQTSVSAQLNYAF